MSAADARPRDGATQENEEMLRMGELARASGVSAATIKHYLREGLLPGTGQDLTEHGLLPG